MSQKQQKAKNMEPHQSPLVRLILPFRATLAMIPRVAVHHFATWTRKTRLAHDVRLISSLDHCVLSDLGMHSFNQLSPEQQEAALMKKFGDGY